MHFENLLSNYQQRVNSALEAHLPIAQTPPSRLHEAMRYTVFNGGKRIRPLLVYFTGYLFDLEPLVLDAPACAVELIHTYSLVHDDLPAMDNDDLRRGKPTCHKAFDEATAILTGDALQTLAFYILAHDKYLLTHLSGTQQLAMVSTLSLASGSRGMAGGQAMDIEAVGRALNLAELESMYIHKTGALIRASVKLGTLANLKLTSDESEKLEHYAKCIGLAFQVQDDILDIESSTEILGKSQGADIANNKITYPTLLGMKAAKDMTADLLQQALESLAGFGERAEPLRWIANYIITRRY